MTARSDELTARVADVLPNGDLVVEGVREIEINGDRQIVVLTGVVRTVDVPPICTRRAGLRACCTNSRGAFPVTSCRASPAGTCTRHSSRIVAPATSQP